MTRFTTLLLCIQGDQHFMLRLFPRKKKQSTEKNHEKDVQWNGKI